MKSASDQLIATLLIVSGSGIPLLSGAGARGGGDVWDVELGDGRGRAARDWAHAVERDGYHGSE